jgi:hypothetical protein
VQEQEMESAWNSSGSGIDRTEPAARFICKQTRSNLQMPDV